MAIKHVYEKEPAPGKLGVSDLFAIGTGQVIGAGVITLIVPAMKMTGNSAWLAYFAAIVLGFLMVLPFFFIGATLRIGGGIHSIISGLAGPYFGGMYAYIFLTQCFGLSLFGTAAAEYLGDVFPILGSTRARIFVAVAILTLFYVVNLFGVDFMAKVQKPMTWSLIAFLLLFAAFGIANARYDVFDFSDPGFLTRGWGMELTDNKITGGFFGAVMLYIFSTNGYSGTVGYGRSAKNARRDVPRALAMIVPTLILIYCGVAIAGSSVMSLEEYGASTTLVYAAQKIFPTWLYYAFILGGPIMCLTTTLNGNFAGRGLNIGQSTKDGWLPPWFGKLNKYGVPGIGLTYFWVVSVIPVLFNLSVTVLTNLIQLVGSFITILTTIAFFNMPRRYPKAWQASRLHVPNPVYYFFCTISAAIACLTIWKSVMSIPTGIAIGNIIVIVSLSTIAIVRAKSKKTVVKVCTSIWGGIEEEDAQIAAELETVSALSVSD